MIFCKYHTTFQFTSPIFLKHKMASNLSLKHVINSIMCNDETCASDDNLSFGKVPESASLLKIL